MLVPFYAFADEPDEGKEEAQGVGGALQSWSSVPLADDATRASGSVHMWGQAQVWATLADQDVSLQADPASYGDPEADTGFSLARARFGFDGFLPMGSLTCCGQVDYAISVGLGAPFDVLTPGDQDLQMVDAFGRWATKSPIGVTSIAAGMQRVPFGREALMSSAHLVFQERAVATHWLTPPSEVGVGASQSFTIGADGPSVLLRGGLYNGNGQLFGDDDPGLMAALRGEFLLGDAYRTWSHDLSPALGVGGSILTNQELTANTNSRGVDVLARWRWISVMGEVITSSVSVGDTAVVTPDLRGDVDRLGMTAQLSVFAPIGAGGVEFAGRYASLDDDRSVETIGDVALVHAGVTWRDLLPGLDLGGGYIHRAESPEFTNDTVRLWMQVRPSSKL